MNDQTKHVMNHSIEKLTKENKEYTKYKNKQQQQNVMIFRLLVEEHEIQYDVTSHACMQRFENIRKTFIC